MKKTVTLILAIALIMCFTACSNSEKTPANTEKSPSSLDALIEFNIPNDFFKSKINEKEMDEHGNITGETWYDEGIMLSANIIEDDMDIKTFVQDNDLKEETYGDNVVYMDEFSKEAQKQMRSCFVESHNHIIQIDWAAQEEPFTDEDIELFHKILTNMKIL